jgi:hypothetical protein
MTRFKLSRMMVACLVIALVVSVLPSPAARAEKPSPDQPGP